MKTENNLLFGILADRLHLVSARKLSEAAKICSENPERNIADVLSELGGISEKDRKLVVLYN